MTVCQSSSAVKDATDCSSPINCLFIVPSLKRAGAESQLIDLVNRLDSAQFRKTVVVLENNLDQMEELDLQSVEVVSLPKQSRFDWRQVHKISELIDALGIDIVHATIQYSVFIAWMARLGSRRSPKLVAAIHTTKNVGLKEEMFDRLLYRWILGRCEHVVFVCEHQRSYWISRFSELRSNSSVIYNGVDPTIYQREDHWQPGRDLLKSSGVPDDHFVVSCIAGFRKEKGHGVLIEAFSRLPPNASLMLAGDGVMRARIEELVSSRGIGERVHFLGNLPDVRPLLAVSDVTVLASTAVETFSMAMLESLSMKVPVVASDIGGLGEAIEQGVTGCLVPPGCVEELEKAMAGFMSAEDLSVIRNNCREVILDRFTSDDMVSATETCLLRVSAGQ